MPGTAARVRSGRWCRRAQQTERADEDDALGHRDIDAWRSAP